MYLGPRTPHTHQLPTTSRIWTPAPAQHQSQQLLCPSMSTQMIYWCTCVITCAQLIHTFLASSHVSCIYAHGHESLLSAELWRKRKCTVLGTFFYQERGNRSIFRWTWRRKRWHFQLENKEKHCLIACWSQRGKVVCSEVEFLLLCPKVQWKWQTGKHRLKLESNELGCQAIKKKSN